jgi:hypothetical protein
VVSQVDNKGQCYLGGQVNECSWSGDVGSHRDGVYS